MSGVTINGKEYGSIEEYMEEINPIIVEPENIDDWIYVVEEDGTITLNGYKGQDKEVVIPNYINGVPVKKIGTVTHRINSGVKYGSFWDPSICKGGSAFYWYIQNDITSVTISNGIETIGGFAFFESQALNKIIIPSSVKTIETNVFSYCIALNEITIPSNVTSIESSVFDHCTSLTEITIPSSVTSIKSGVFAGCTSLTEITIPSSVTSIGSNAFGNCTSLTEITIPSSVTSIGRQAFYGCTSLTEITIQDSVTTMEGYVFYSTSSITVHVPWKEGEKPEGWDDNWNKTNAGTITVDYAK